MPPYTANSRSCPDPNPSYADILSPVAIRSLKAQTYPIVGCQLDPIASAANLDVEALPRNELAILGEMILLDPQFKGTS